MYKDKKKIMIRDKKKSKCFREIEEKNFHFKESQNKCNFSQNYLN